MRPKGKKKKRPTGSGRDKTGGEERFAVEFADAATISKLEHASELLSPESVTAKTPAELPRAYIVRLIAPGRRVVHMFDAAGELYYTAEQIQDCGISTRPGRSSWSSIRCRSRHSGTGCSPSSRPS